MGTTLELDHVSCRFGDFTAVDDVSLSINDGSFVVLLGPSGCGKTTTLRMIAGFETPTSGEIQLNGKVLSQAKHVVPPERRDMSMMFQSYAVWPHMTVKKNVQYGLKARKVEKAAMLERTARSLEAVQLDALSERYPSELSGGQQQRVALARAMASDPSVLLMDEPLSNLDAKLRTTMRDMLRDLHREVGFTAVYVTHDQSEAMALADQIVVMNAGRIQQVGTPTELYKRPLTEFVAGFIGRAELLPARVIDDELLSIGGSRVRYESVADLASGSDAWAVLRPIGVEIVDGAGTPGVDEIDVEVIDRQFLGEAQQVKIRITGVNQTLNIDFDPYLQLEIGDRMRCKLNNVVAVARDSASASDDSASAVEDVKAAAR